MAQTDDDIRADDDGMAQAAPKTGTTEAELAYQRGVEDGYLQALNDVAETIKRQKFMATSGVQVNL